MSFLKNLFSLRKNHNKENTEKQVKIVRKKTEVYKSPEIKRNKKIINDNKNEKIKNVHLQSPQKRNISKKAIKKKENNNNKKNEKCNENNTYKENNLDKEREEKDENILKLKTSLINKSNKNNYLKVSKNTFDFFNDNNNIKNNNDVFLNKNDKKQLLNDMKPKTEIKVKNRKINKYDENNKNSNMKVSLNNDIFFNKEINNEEIKPMNIINKKSYINEDNIINNINILVPLTNYRRENNCFLNVLIQSLFNLNEFREYLLETLYNKAQNEVIKELCELINSYKNIKEKSKNENQKIEATLSVNLLRTHLNNSFGNYTKGESGDPMETLERILDLIHKEYLTLNLTKEGDNCNCPSHNFFFLDLSEIKQCPNCHEMDIKPFDKNCYTFNIFIPEISNIILKKNQNFDSYKLHLFKIIKELNEIYEDENKIKISKCTCTELNYRKEIKLIQSDNPYLIINLTWAEEFPNFKEIIKIYGLLPICEKYNNLFNLENKEINKTFYIKSIILYGIYHYVYIIYLNTEKKWGIVDDKNIKYIDKYYDLVDCLLRNHLMPVGLIYSQNKNDSIEENEINKNILSYDEYSKLYKFCEEIENRKELKVDNIVIVKGSFNKTNENYLENNVFYKKMIELVNSSSDSDYEECKKKIEKTNNNNNNNNNSINEEEEKNENINENEQKEEKQDLNIDNINKNKNDKEDNNDKEIDNVNDIWSKRKYIGDFGRNNIKGGLILFNSSYDEGDNEEKNNNDNKDNKKEDKKDSFLGIGKNYLGDD